MPTPILFEAEVLPGLEPFAVNELRARFGDVVGALKPASGRVPFAFEGALNELTSLRTVTAVYRVMTFDVPRPKALLGHQYVTAVLNAARDIIRGQRDFVTLSLDAAGSDSSVMQRIKNELADALNLTPSNDKGDLHLRIRTTPDGRGWQVMIRVTPRPLATRAWRQHNFQGALNAAAASVMASMTAPSADDRILNLACGSGSLMVERAMLEDWRLLVGVDNNPSVLEFARDHLHLANVSRAAIICADATRLPYSTRSFDVLLADLPFGQLVGSHRENIKLYPAIIAEAARVAEPGARFAVITHEKRLISDVLRAQSTWSIVRQVPVNLNGLHPEITLLMLR